MRDPIPRTPDEQAAYRDGLDAGWRGGKYEGATQTPDCPYAGGTREAEIWWDGFGDGTEDFIANKYAE